MEEFQEDPQSQKKQKNDQSKEKMNKESSQSDEAPKENYIHMRARRGQATNSHSLAERVKYYLNVVKSALSFLPTTGSEMFSCFLFCFVV